MIFIFYLLAAGYGWFRKRAKFLTYLTLILVLLRGTIIVNRTYDVDENLYNYLFLLTIFGPIYYDPP